MQTETEAPQGLPEGETAREAAFLNAPDTATEQAQTPEGEDQPKPAAEEAAKPASEEPAPAEPEKPKQTPWFQRRIDDLTREKWEERRRADALEAALKAVKQPQPEEGEPTPAQPAIPLDAVERRAAEIAAQNEFNRRSNEIYEAGVKEYSGDFDASLRTFQMLGGLPPALVEAAQEAGDAHKILHQLGKNPDEAARILSLPPVRMAAAVAKLASSASAPAPRPISSAPAPIKPITGQGTVDKDPEKMSMAEWVKWHDSRQNTG